MTIHDPLLAQRYGGQEAYEQLVTDGAFNTKTAFSDLEPLDKVGYIASCASIGSLSLLMYTIEDNAVPNVPFAATVLTYVGFTYILSMFGEYNLSLRYPKPDAATQQ